MATRTKSASIAPTQPTKAIAADPAGIKTHESRADHTAEGKLVDLSPSYPPFRMKASEAAYYAGMSVTAFFRAVEQGELPQGKKAIGGRYWLRADLEAAMLATDDKSHNFGQRI